MQVYNRVFRSEKASVTGSWRGKKRVGSKFGKGRVDKEPGVLLCWHWEAVGGLEATKKI